MNGIVKCPNCNRNYIFEEMQEHSCKPLVYRSGGRGSAYFSESWEEISYDGGQTWYRINHQPKVNTNNTTDKETEPVSRNCFLIG